MALWPHGWVGISMFRDNSPYLSMVSIANKMFKCICLPSFSTTGKENGIFIVGLLEDWFLQFFLLAACLLCTKLIRLAPCLQFIN